MDSGEREQEARQHADEQHIPRQAAAGQQARDQAGPSCQATGTQAAHGVYTMVIVHKGPAPCFASDKDKRVRPIFENRNL